MASVKISCNVMNASCGFVSFYRFFFQAEDGIRDRDVTGVQTCALPISQARPGKLDRGRQGGDGIVLAEYDTLQVGLKRFEIGRASCRERV